MLVALFFLILLGIPALVWIGVSIWRERLRRHRGYPPATEGGEPTIYRRPRPSSEQQASV